MNSIEDINVFLRDNGLENEKGLEGFPETKSFGRHVDVFNR